MTGIYKITNKQNGKIYIGQSDNIERRLAEHKRVKSQTIDNYINCLGIENFEFEIIEECKKEDLDKKEQEYIQKYDSRKNGYNHQLGGYNNSAGEGNGRALLTEADVINIRTAYAEHINPSQLYEEQYKDKITKSQFQAV